jgi:predicted transposase/invertase (TIGR01784 family)
MDISELEKGEFFSNMKESYIIFICMFDPFGADMPIYTVKQTFEENEKLIFDDKTHKIFYNVNAFEKLSNDVETKAFLEYLCKHQSTTKFTQSLETAVYRNKNNQNWRQNYMTLAYDMYMVAKEAAEVAAEKAFENGFSAGEERGISIGLSQGITQGEKKAKLETAKTLLAFGDSIEKVSKVTGLSVEEIEKL